MDRGRARLGGGTRVALVVAALGLVGVLATARVLRPDPRGYGTHTQLGLRPCEFLGRTGLRCPSCGMTTAFAWATRGRFDLAWRANPAGSVLAPSSLVVIGWLLSCAATGRPCWGARSIDGPLIALVVAAVAASLAAWIARWFLDLTH